MQSVIIIPSPYFTDRYIFSRDHLDMDLTTGKGLTHLYYTGETIWPFGYGKSTLPIYVGIIIDACACVYEDTVV